jgi:4'-phosphopantetheinyl transferase
VTAPVHPFHVVREVPPDSSWLTPAEIAVERTLRAERRRNWRAGRYAAKCLLQRVLAVSQPSDIEVHNAPDGAPEARILHRPAPLLSLTHRAEVAAAACSADGRPVGIDLERIEMRTDRFVRDFFTSAEVSACFASPVRDLHAVTVWSAKEGVLKCTRTGLRRDTRSVEVDLRTDEDPPSEGMWRPVAAVDRVEGTRYEGWWRIEGEFVLTLMTPAGS